MKYNVYICFIQQGMKFSLYNILKKKYENPYVNGFISGSLQGLILCNFEAKKTLKQLNNNLKPNKHIYSTIILRDSLFSSLFFGINDTKMEINNDLKKIICGSLAAFVTSPLDLIKAKLGNKNYNINLIYNNYLKYGISYFLSGSMYRSLHMGSRYFIILKGNELILNKFNINPVIS